MMLVAAVLFLVGVGLGLRCNVRAPILLSGVLALGPIAGHLIGAEIGAVTILVAIGALQFGYVSSLLTAATRLPAEEPAPARLGAKAARRQA